MVRSLTAVIPAVIILSGGAPSSTPGDFEFWSSPSIFGRPRGSGGRSRSGSRWGWRTRGGWWPAWWHQWFSAQTDTDPSPPPAGPAASPPLLQHKHNLRASHSPSCVQFHLRLFTQMMAAAHTFILTHSCTASTTVDRELKSFWAMSDGGGGPGLQETDPQSLVHNSNRLLSLCVFVILRYHKYKMAEGWWASNKPDREKFPLLHKMFKLFFPE